MGMKWISVCEGVRPDTDLLAFKPSIGDVVLGHGGFLIGAFLETMGHQSRVAVDRSHSDINEMVRRHHATIVDLPDNMRNLAEHLEIEPPMSNDTVLKLARFIRNCNLVDSGHDGMTFSDVRGDQRCTVAEW
jgi:hypothetical protein